MEPDEKKEQGKEMDDMLNLKGPEETKEVKVEDNPKPEEEVKPKEEVKAEEKPKEEKVEVKPEDKKPEEVKPDEKPQKTEAELIAEQLSADNEKLRQQLNDLAKLTGQHPRQAEEKVELKPEEKVKVKVDGEVKFITKEEAEDLLDNPEKLNVFLNRVFQAGREQVMKEMPTLVRQQTLSEMSLQQLTTKFWSENKDLDSVKDFVGMVANQIEVEHPDWDYAKVFEETATTVRQRLSLPTPGEKPKEEVKEEVEVSLKPALPGGQKGARRTVEEPNLSTDQKELDDLWKHAEGNK